MTETDERMHQAWVAWLEQHLGPFEAKSPPRTRWPSLSGRSDPNPLYTPLDIAGDYMESLGFPGNEPFTRGVQPNMYRGRLWTMRQYAGFGTAAESNERYKHLLERGQTGLSVAFDLPTQMGRDSDHPVSRGEVGKVGVAIDSIEDMETLLRDLPLEKISTSMTINATAAILLALYVVVAERRGVPSAALRGTIQNDILKEYVARGTYVYPPEPSLRLTRDVFAWAKEHTPKWNVISVSGYHMREAGCDAIQEVAFTLGNGIAYADAALRAGMTIDEFGLQASFFFNAHNNFLEEVAKFRAARRLWARILKERYGARDPRALALRFHAQTGGSTLQAQQPLVNTVRTSLQALSAILGGCQSLHTNAYDEALSLPTEESATLALRTQQVIAYESGVADVVDPLGGSYAIEALTDRIENGARQYLAQIDALGGMVAAIEHGFVQREIQAAAYTYQLDVERGERIVVGVNRFTESEPKNAPHPHERPGIETEQVERLRALRRRRNNETYLRAIADVESRAREGTNLMPAIVAAVKENATVGEISDAIRRVFGEYTPRSSV